MNYARDYIKCLFKRKFFLLLFPRSQKACLQKKLIQLELRKYFFLKSMKKICIIEDDSGISASLKLYLENSDYEVALWNTGEKALDFIEETSPQLIILDINLPVMSGIEICREIRKTKNTPIIILTARGSESDRIE